MPESGKPTVDNRSKSLKSANLPIPEVSSIKERTAQKSKVVQKRKERYFHARTKEYQTDIQFKTKGARYFIRASGRTEDLDTKDTSPPTAWKTLYADKQVRVYGTTATRDTDYTINGENVFFMKFKDGRRIRIYPNDFTRKRVTAIQKVLKEHNNIVN